MHKKTLSTVWQRVALDNEDILICVNRLEVLLLEAEEAGLRFNYKTGLYVLDTEIFAKEICDKMESGQQKEAKKMLEEPVTILGKISKTLPNTHLVNQTNADGFKLSLLTDGETLQMAQADINPNIARLEIKI